jgi:membrane protein DedA with SNARE-associated domain
VSLGHLITQYGYLALFILVGAESLGVPLPGETALILAGAYAGTTHRMSPWAIFAVAAAAAIIGDNIGYWIGDKGGYRLARAHGRRIRLDERKLKIARYLFDRHGVKVVFFGRFVSILRTYAAFLAGTSKMRYRKFLPANAAGGIVWSAIYTIVAYFAGRALERDSGIIDLALGIAAAVAIVAALLLVRRQAGRLAQRAEEAYPGPLQLRSVARGRGWCRPGPCPGGGANRPGDRPAAGRSRPRYVGRRADLDVHRPPRGDPLRCAVGRLRRTITRGPVAHGASVAWAPGRRPARATAQATTGPAQFVARCRATGTARRPDRARSQENSAPAAAVAATPAATRAAARRRSPARSLISSAAAVGRMCHTPNTPLATAIAAGPGITRRSAAWSTPRNAISSHSTVPTGIRNATW